MRVRKLIFKLHMYVGLSLGLLLGMIGLTGSLLVFGDEIDRFLNPGLLRVEAGGQRAPLQAVLDAVRQAYPNDKVARIRLPRDSKSPSEVCFTAKEDPRCAYVDPYSAKILGSRVPAQSFKGRLYSLHRRLLSGETGATIIGIAGILLLAMSLSGVVLWWPGRKNVSRGWTIKWGGSRYKINYDLHRVLGVCAMVFLSVTAFTGAAMTFRPSFENTLNRLSSNSPPLAKPASTLRAGSAPPLDVIMRNADTALPNAETTMVSLPGTPTAAIIVRKRLSGEMHPNGRSLVYLDQYSGGVLHVESSLQTPLGTRIGSYLYPIHVGLLGGTVTRVLQVVAGFVLAGLFFTGLVMWWNRVVAKRYRYVTSVSRIVDIGCGEAVLNERGRKRL